MASAIDLYPTRGEEERILDRCDPVVFGNREPASKYGLTPEQVAAYERDGFLLLPNAFPPEEVEIFIRDFYRLGQLPELWGREEMILEPDSDTPRSVFNPHRFSELFERISSEPHEPLRRENRRHLYERLPGGHQKPPRQSDRPAQLRGGDMHGLIPSTVKVGLSLS